MEYYLVDVFAETKYTGNQLAVFTGAKVANLTTIEMQQIAQEINYSETTFIRSGVNLDGGYEVRIFTPKTELPFAGHPTLGTAYIIQQKLINQPVPRVILNYPIGQIPVEINYRDNVPDILWMRQKFPVFDQIFTAEAIAPMLNLDQNEIDDRFPIQSVSTGVPFIIVPLKTLASLKKAKINLDRYWQFVKNNQVSEILIFTPETYDHINDLNVRVFAEALGIPEDPATGSANGCLAGYLVKYTYFGKSTIDVKVEQGYEIDRPSLLLLQAQPQKDGIEVNVGGKVIMVARGEFI